MIVPHQERFTVNFFKKNCLAACAVKIKETHHQNENCTLELLETESKKNVLLFLGCLTKQEGV